MTTMTTPHPVGSTSTTLPAPPVSKPTNDSAPFDAAPAMPAMSSSVPHGSNGGAATPPKPSPPPSTFWTEFEDVLLEDYTIRALAPAATLLLPFIPSEEPAKPIPSSAADGALPKSSNDTKEKPEDSPGVVAMSVIGARAVQEMLTWNELAKPISQVGGQLIFQAALYVLSRGAFLFFWIYEILVGALCVYTAFSFFRTLPCLAVAYSLPSCLQGFLLPDLSSLSVVSLTSYYASQYLLTFLMAAIRPVYFVLPAVFLVLLPAALDALVERVKELEKKLERTEKALEAMQKLMGTPEEWKELEERCKA
ncbi:hypothetical protein JCM8547_009199 [Rhodosporidiobolus lusitaniae]